MRRTTSFFAPKELKRFRFTVEESENFLLNKFLSLGCLGFPRNFSSLKFSFILQIQATSLFRS